MRDAVVGRGALRDEEPFGGCGEMDLDRSRFAERAAGAITNVGQPVLHDDRLASSSASSLAVE